MNSEPKEIREKILKILYKHRQEDMVRIDILQKGLKDAGLGIDEKTLHGEIIYLEEEGYLKIIDEGSIGKEYLYFNFLKITSNGVNLVEDPEEFNKLFTIKVNNFGNVSNSNLAFDSPNSSQNIKIKKEEITTEIKEILEKIKTAIENNEIEKADGLMAKLKKASANVFYGVVANGIFQFLSNFPK